MSHDVSSHLFHALHFPVLGTVCTWENRAVQTEVVSYDQGHTSNLCLKKKSFKAPTSQHPPVQAPASLHSLSHTGRLFDWCESVYIAVNENFYDSRSPVPTVLEAISSYCLIFPRDHVSPLSIVLFIPSVLQHCFHSLGTTM